jgi:hypothetical protein
MLGSSGRVVPRGPPVNHPRPRSADTPDRCGMSDTTSAQPTGWVSVSVMETLDVDYGRCSGCHELKHVAGGIVAEHNGYDTDGTSVTVVRCPGSGRPPVDAEEEVAPASS